MPFARRHGLWPSILCGACGAILGAALWTALVRPANAYGQIPDAGAQRKEMIQELHSVNQKLGEMTALLRDIREQTRPRDKP